MVIEGNYSLKKLMFGSQIYATSSEYLSQKFVAIFVYSVVVDTADADSRTAEIARDTNLKNFFAFGRHFLYSDRENQSELLCRS